MKLSASPALSRVTQRATAAAAMAVATISAGISPAMATAADRAEWEYVARAGQSTKYAGSNSAGAIAWYDDNSGNKTHPVGQESQRVGSRYERQCL